jgi:hypothetical protein
MPDGNTGQVTLLRSRGAHRGHGRLSASRSCAALTAAAPDTPPSGATLPGGDNQGEKPFRKLTADAQGDLTQRYQGLMRHYGMEALSPSREPRPKPGRPKKAISQIDRDQLRQAGER